MAGRRERQDVAGAAILESPERRTPQASQRFAAEGSLTPVMLQSIFDEVECARSAAGRPNDLSK